MTVDEIIKAFGGVPAAAEALGVSRQTIYNWARAGEVPMYRQQQAELLIREAAARGSLSR